MAHPPQRRPGDPNARPDVNAPMDVVRQSHAEGGADAGYGAGNHTITRGIVALVEVWKKRRDGRRR